MAIQEFAFKGNMQEVTILPKLYDLILWYSHKTVNYPKTYKYNLGERVNCLFFDILENIIEAQYNTKKKSYFLRNANINLEKLRFMFRLSKDLQCITLKDYEHASRELNEIGKMVGGWEKYSKNKESNSSDDSQPSDD